MTLSNAIKKEIAKTFLKNIEKPIPIICSEICKKLNQTFLKDEIVIYNEKKYKVLENEETYKIENINTSQIETVAFSSLKREREHSKNDVYEFLCENTNETVFGKVLKKNVLPDINKADEKERRAYFERKQMNSMILLPATSKKNPSFFSDDVISFEIFAFVVGNKKFLKTRAVPIKQFFEQLEDESYCFDLIRSLFVFVKALEGELDFIPKLRSAIGFCELKNQSKRTLNPDVNLQQMTRLNYKEFLNSLFYVYSQLTEDKRFLILIDADIKHIIKFFIDFVIKTSEFKKYVDTLIETTRQREKLRYEVNTKLRKMNASASVNEGEKKYLFDKHVEVERLLLHEKTKFCIGTHEGNYFLVAGALYKIVDNLIYAIGLEQVEGILKMIKGTKDCLELSQNLRRFREFQLYNRQ